MRSPGIEPGSPAWQASVLPLNHERFHTGIELTTTDHTVRFGIHAFDESTDNINIMFALCKPKREDKTKYGYEGDTDSLLCRSSIAMP